ncbi:MAG: CIA30 family protein [Gammaproteobacteria bacterium]|nr:CIA30 family protein [Gammaproteobacteria bacterium]
MTSLSSSNKRLFIVDDRRSGDLRSTLGPSWRLITDGVMGGLSSGRVDTGEVAGRPCLCLRGQVRLDRNGGFVQAGITLAEDLPFDASGFAGVLLDVYGNDEAYNIHLRTANLWQPWQSYRVSFIARPRWQTLKLPFDEFRPHRVGVPPDFRQLTRIGLVAIGRAFTADVCVARIAFC